MVIKIGSDRLVQPVELRTRPASSPISGKNRQAQEPVKNRDKTGKPAVWSVISVGPHLDVVEKKKKRRSRSPLTLEKTLDSIFFLLGSKTTENKK